jgi:hypothetical protein
MTRWEKTTWAILLTCSIALMIGCAAKTVVLNESEQLYDAPDHPGYIEVSKGQYAKMLKCCNDCLTKTGN